MSRKQDEKCTMPSHLTNNFIAAAYLYLNVNEVMHHWKEKVQMFYCSTCHAREVVSEDEDQITTTLTIATKHLEPLSCTPYRYFSGYVINFNIFITVRRARTIRNTSAGIQVHAGGDRSICEVSLLKHPHSPNTWLIRIIETIGNKTCFHEKDSIGLFLHGREIPIKEHY